MSEHEDLEQEDAMKAGYDDARPLTLDMPCKYATGSGTISMNMLRDQVLLVAQVTVYGLRQMCQVLIAGGESPSKRRVWNRYHQRIPNVETSEQ